MSIQTRPVPRKQLMIATGRFDRMVAPDNLAAAWAKVKGNNGAAGGDGVTCEAFAGDAARRLEQLRRALACGTYRPGPLRNVPIPKPSGGERTLSIPCIVDRIAQTAVLNEIVPALDARMSQASFAYRPGRSVAQALALARKKIRGGAGWVVDADIERFFDSVPHEALAQELAIWIDDLRLYRLAMLWVRTLSRGGVGLPQGAPLSPLLANHYLHPLDRMLAVAGIGAVRHADDFVLLCASEQAAWRAKRVVEKLLAHRGLTLDKARTRVAGPGEDVVFPGELLAPRAAPGWMARIWAWLAGWRNRRMRGGRSNA